ncbi:MAG: hypothetical protein A2297_02410 [Elusimicrobia bacterium RIFOXYB2_FULL_48_7]|nr:MAG: hypothetical protein A2297_02410 [Elusimicrobia bacterium RIFOXYB2_FULL_48_7]
MKCPKCGYENPESAKDLNYCSMCYEPFSKQSGHDTSGPAGAGTASKNMDGSGNPMFSKNMYQQGPASPAFGQDQEIPEMAPSAYDTPAPQAPQKSKLASYVIYAAVASLSFLFFFYGPAKTFRSVLVYFDRSSHSQTDYSDSVTGIKIERPSGWGWVILTSEADMIDAYDLQSLADMGAKPIVAVRNKIYDSHLVFINFPKHLFPGGVPSMPVAFGRFSDGMSQTPDMKDFKYTGDSTTYFGPQEYMQRAFATQYRGVNIEGFFGIFERIDSYVILLSMYEKSASEPSTEAFMEVKKSIKLDFSKNTLPSL